MESLRDIGNYFCKMHLLLNMATECNKVLAELDHIVVSNQHVTSALPQSGEGGAGRLARTAVKALHPRGCEKSGAAQDFMSFLGESDRALKLVPFKGNRFNILFYDAGTTYYRRGDIKAFLESLPEKNRLHAAFLQDLSCDAYMAGLRALDMIDKLIAGPFWKFMNVKESIVDLNSPLAEMKQNVEDLTKDGSSLLDGSCRIFPDLSVHFDVIFDSLFQPSENLDDLTQATLEALMHVLLLISDRQAEDHLEGGKYCNPTESKQTAASNVPTTNLISERDFGSLDVLMRMKPATSTLYLEYLIMWSHNKTSKWLKELSVEKKERIMVSGRKDTTIVEHFSRRAGEIR